MPRPGSGSASREITGINRADWLEWMQLQNNTVGCNDHTGGRTDLFLWYPDLSDKYVQGNIGLHDGLITLADEQAHWTAWKSKLATNRVTVGA